MLIFISGSINSGKTTTARALAKKMSADCIDVDELTERIPNFNLKTDLDKAMDITIAEINNSIKNGKDVVANYVLRQKDYERFASEVHAKNQFVFTLAPRLEIAQSNRGNRELSDWEVERIKHHYDRGIASPAFGCVIDTSEMSVNEVVDEIMRTIEA